MESQYIYRILTVSLSCGSNNSYYCNEQVIFSRMYNTQTSLQKWPKILSSSCPLVFTRSLHFPDFPSLQSSFLFTRFTSHSSMYCFRFCVVFFHRILYIIFTLNIMLATNNTDSNTTKTKKLWTFYIRHNLTTARYMTSISYNTLYLQYSTTHFKWYPIPKRFLRKSELPAQRTFPLDKIAL